jgi:hypothetical protein
MLKRLPELDVNFVDTSDAYGPDDRQSPATKTIRRRIGKGAIKLRGCRSEQFRRLTRRCGRDPNK